MMTEKHEKKELNTTLLEYVVNDLLRQTELDQILVERGDKYVDRFITVVSAALGLSVGLSQLTQPIGLPWYSVEIILFVPFLLGAISYTRLFSLDLHFHNNSRARHRIKATLIEDYPDFQRFVHIGTSVTRDKIEGWASPRSILAHAVTFAGPKTIIALSNSFLLSAMCFVLIVFGMQLHVVAAGFIFPVIALSLSLAIHVGYARVRYLLYAKILDS